MSISTPTDRSTTCPAQGGPADAFVTLDTFHAPPKGPPGKPDSNGAARPFASTCSNPFHRFTLRRRDLVIAAALFAVALAARAPLIARGHTLLHSDEAIVGLMAQDIAAGQRFPIYFYGQRYMGALEAYVVAALLPVFSDPMHALRAAPAMFFAALVAVQFLMLTRWFGRRAGLVAAAVLVCGPPMFAQWTISARGAYIENLLWGTLLVWAYAEWFTIAGAKTPSRTASHVAQIPSRTSSPARRQFVFGALAGSGLWLNPSVAFFLAPILIHYLLGRPLHDLRSRIAARHLRGWRLIDRLGVCALPVAAIAALLMLNIAWSVRVDDAGVKTTVLFDLLPRPAALAVLACLAVWLLWRINARQRLADLIRRGGPMLLGALAGSAPAALYAVSALAGRHAMEPSLPLGIRPLWTLGDTLVYFINGLPVFFGADPAPFLKLVTVGREPALAAPDLAWAGLMRGAGLVVLGAAVTALVVLLISNGGRITAALRLDSSGRPPRPVALLALGAAGCIGLFLVGGCSFNFTTIRYWLPIWVFLPGLLAVIYTNRQLPLAGRAAVVALCLAWAAGQADLHRQIGRPHPLTPVADALVADGVESAVAETLDAHLLSYLTGQRCRVREFDAFWSRLAHFDAGQCASYLVRPDEPDRAWDWIGGGFPGDLPPEARRKLWPALRRQVALDPRQELTRQALPAGYVLLHMAEPLPADRPPSRQ